MAKHSFVIVKSDELFANLVTFVCKVCHTHAYIQREALAIALQGSAPIVINWMSRSDDLARFHSTPSKEVSASRFPCHPTGYGKLYAHIAIDYTSDADSEFMDSELPFTPSQVENRWVSVEELFVSLTQPYDGHIARNDWVVNP